jgi:hypothetical protein
LRTLATTLAVDFRTLGTVAPSLWSPSLNERKGDALPGYDALFSSLKSRRSNASGDFSRCAKSVAGSTMAIEYWCYLKNTTQGRYLFRTENLDL